MSMHTSEPSHQEIQEFLGVYALDAVDPETAEMVERHLAECVRCSIEVAHHHEVAGLLANSGGASPAGLWDGIARQLDGTAPPSWERLARRLDTDPDREMAAPDGVPDTGVSDRGAPSPAPSPGRAPSDRSPEAPAPVVPIGSGNRRQRLAMRAAVVVAAAAAVVAVAFGVQVNHLHHQVSALQAPSGMTQAEQAALDSPSAKKVLLSSPVPTGGAATRVTVVLTASGTGFVEGGSLSTLPRSQTYQLWGVIGHQTISLGLLGPDPQVVPFTVAGDGRVVAFAITAERAGGVVETTRQPVVAGEVTA